MASKEISTQTIVSILEEETQLTLRDLCRACSVHAERIIELVEEGILEPAGTDIIEWRFTGTSLIRARTAIRLQQDLHINTAGVALALDLMDEIEELRRQLSALTGH